MDARLYRHFVCIVLAILATGASYRTQNFFVRAATPQLAKEACEKAESDRKRLAIEWLGRELPRWRKPCPITVQCHPRLGAGGETSFVHTRNGPTDWIMTVSGSRERILDSVIPHEVLHTIFASHFKQPVPRWADEGAATSVEHISEKAKHHQNLVSFLMNGGGIAFHKMFAMMEYPQDNRSMMCLYAQGHSVARYLLVIGGKRKYVAFVRDGMYGRGNDRWTVAVKKHYGHQSLATLQSGWLSWVKSGSSDTIRRPGLENPETRLASATAPAGNSGSTWHSAPATKTTSVPVQPKPWQSASAATRVPAGMVAAPSHSNATPPPTPMTPAPRPVQLAENTRPSRVSPPAAPWKYRDNRREASPAGPTADVAFSDPRRKGGQTSPPGTSAARQPETGHPRETILEWSRTSPPARSFYER